MIFDSYNNPVPSVRRDLELIPINDKGREILYFHDALKYMQANFALDLKVQPILSLLTGRHSVEQITSLLNNSIGHEELLSFIQFLDDHLILESKNFKIRSEEFENDFESSSVRKPALAGQSYPDDKKSYKRFIGEILESESSPEILPKKALFAPHIEIQIGRNSYSRAFSSLKKIAPKRVVIFATAHYAGLYGSMYDNLPFIGTQKDFELPGRTISTDKKVIEALNKNSENTGFTVHDRAHRIEHSIETHLVFLDQIWKHEFEIVPILVSSFDELFYKKDGDLASKLNAFSDQIKSLDDKDTFYLISGDLSHIGKKFGDSDAASKIRDKASVSDRKFIRLSEENNPDLLLEQIGKNYDAYRVCGFSPILTFMKAFPGIKGHELSYEWWDETERESAVSFGAIGY